jgi:hypothetical protein
MVRNSDWLFSFSTSSQLAHPSEGLDPDCKARHQGAEGKDCSRPVADIGVRRRDCRTSKAGSGWAERSNHSGCRSMGFTIAFRSKAMTGTAMTDVHVVDDVVVRGQRRPAGVPDPFPALAIWLGQLGWSRGASINRERSIPAWPPKCDVNGTVMQRLRQQSIGAVRSK